MADPQPARPRQKAGKMPEAAYMEECDSDESSAVPNTRVHASASAAGRGNPSGAKPTRGRDAASDSGYSSHASSQHFANSHALAPAATAPAATLPPSLRQSSSQSSSTQPGLRRSSSTRAPQRAPPTPTEGSGVCTNPACTDPTCLSTRNPDRRYTLPNQDRPMPPPKAPTQYPMAPPPVPLQTGQRPRAGSVSRSRPASIHGYSLPSIHTSFDATARGPPPSSSAYYTTPFTATAAPLVANTSSTYYPPPSPGLMSPLSPTFSAFPAAPQYSARTASYCTSGLEPTRVATMPPQSDLPSARMLSARISHDREPVESDFSSDSESDSSSHDERTRRGSQRRPSLTARQTQMLMDQSSSRRPGVSKSYTTSSVPRSRDSRPSHYLRQTPHSDTGQDYTSSDQADSDRTARATIARRETVSSSTRSSRQPSIATTNSSGRTKATSMTSVSDFSKVLVEDSNGRSYTTYMPHAELTRRLARQKLEDEVELKQRRLQDDISAYQHAVGGGEPYELTAENIRQQQKRNSGSHVSGSARSHKSSGSKGSRADVIKIQSGDTVLHVYGEAKIEMRQSENGGPAEFVIAGGSSRDSGYHTTSKGSSSHKSRSHVSGGRREYLDDYADRRDRY